MNLKHVRFVNRVSKAFLTFQQQHIRDADSRQFYLDDITCKDYTLRVMAQSKRGTSEGAPNPPLRIVDGMLYIPLGKDV